MSFKAEHSWKGERRLINPQVLIHFETWPILQSQSTENVHTVVLIKPVTAIRDTEQVQEAECVGEQEMEPGQTSCHKHTHTLFFQIQTQAYLFLFQGCTHCTRDTFSVTSICPCMVKLPPYSNSCWLVVSIRAVLAAPHSNNPNCINNSSMAKNLILVVCPHLVFGWTGRQDRLTFLLLLRSQETDSIFTYIFIFF